MSTIAKLSNGSLLKKGDGAAPEVFTTIPGVRKLSGPAVDFDLLDVSDHDTPNLFREFIPGWSDGDVIRAMVSWRPSNTVHVSVRTDAYAATLRNLKIVFPDTSLNTVTMSTYLKTWVPTADPGQEMRADLSAKITGAPVWS